MTKEQLLAEVEDLLKTMPPRPTIRHETEENLSWMGRLSAVIEAWNPAKGTILHQNLDEFRSVNALDATRGFRSLVTLLHQAGHDLRMQTIGPTNIALGRGMVFDYFDQIRKVLELAKQDLFFIDPYLDADFISRYLPHAASGVAVRLLAREKMSTLLPAVDAFVQQSKMVVHVRSAPGFHDRYVIVDKASCYQSGASFKDGARLAPTTVTQITDAFAAVMTTYDDLWNRARTER